MLVVGQASETERAVAYFIASVIAVSLYNSVETVVLIFASFRRYKGTYFWSLLIASTGVFVTSFGYATYFYNIIPNRFGQSTVTIVGWWTFVIAQSLVLWSRLHLVVYSRRIIRGVLIMIIMTTSLLLLPTGILAWLNNFQPPKQEILRGYQIMENIQLTILSAQETIISVIYIMGTIKLLSDSQRVGKRNILLQLITINVIIIFMDCILLVLQYLSYRTLQISIKCFVYSLKLKLELAVLSRLVDFVRGADGSQLPSPTTTNQTDYPQPSSGHLTSSSAISGETGGQYRKHLSALFYKFKSRSAEGQ